MDIKRCVSWTAKYLHFFYFDKYIFPENRVFANILFDFKMIFTILSFLSLVFQDDFFDPNLNLIRRFFWLSLVILFMQKKSH